MKLVRMATARNRLEKSVYAERTTYQEWHHRLAMAFGWKPFSVHQAATALCLSLKKTRTILSRIPGIIILGADMVALAEPSPLRDRVRSYCVEHRQSIVDVFKKSGVGVPHGVQWMSGRAELNQADETNLEAYLDKPVFK
jgi:hypothetical protein